MDMAKEIAVGVGTWIITSLIVWAFARNKIARDWFADRPWATALALSLKAVGLALGYTQYTVSALRAALLTGPTPTGDVHCNPGQYVVGINRQAESGVGEHGAIYAIQIVCQPLNVK